MRKSGTMLKNARIRAAGCLPLALFALTVGVAEAQAPAPAPAADAKTFTDMVNNRCVKCHNTEDWAGSVAMDTMDLNHAGQNPEVWEKAIAKLRSRLMPPAGAPQPSQPDVDSVVNYLETTVDASATAGTAGHVPIQRLRPRGVRSLGARSGRRRC